MEKLIENIKSGIIELSRAKDRAKDNNPHYHNALLDVFKMIVIQEREYEKQKNEPELKEESYKGTA